jgi:hypothetical protein
LAVAIEIFLLGLLLLYFETLVDIESKTASLNVIDDALLAELADKALLVLDPYTLSFLGAGVFDALFLFISFIFL